MKLDRAIQYCKERVDNTLCGHQHKQLQEWLEELQYYRSLEEQGWLVELPVPIGKRVWKIYYQRRHDKIYSVGIEPCEFKLILLERFGDTVFKTRAEAESRLAELEETE